MIFQLLLLSSFTLLSAARIRPKLKSGRRLADALGNTAALVAFTARFTTIKQSLGTDTEAQTAIRSLESGFYQRLSDRIDDISKSAPANITNNDLFVSAFATLDANEVETGASGTSIGSSVVISGAKGKVSLKNNTKTAVRTLAVAETLDSSTSVSLISYATLLPDNTYNLEVKINDFYQKARRNQYGQFVDSIILSKNFQLNKKKSAFGLSRVFMLTLDKNYLKFSIYSLIAGSSLRPDFSLIKSKSIVRIKTYVVKDNVYQCSINDGVFLSENTCGFVGTCISNYYGWLRVDTSVQIGSSIGIADKNSQTTISNAQQNTIKTSNGR